MLRKRREPYSPHLKDDRVAAEVTEAFDLHCVASLPRQDQVRSPHTESRTDSLRFGRGPRGQPKLVRQLSTPGRKLRMTRCHSQGSAATTHNQRVRRHVLSTCRPQRPVVPLAPGTGTLVCLTFQPIRTGPDGCQSDACPGPARSVWRRDGRLTSSTLLHAGPASQPRRRARFATGAVRTPWTPGERAPAPAASRRPASPGPAGRTCR